MSELRTFRSYDEFFSFYLAQHSAPGNRWMHAIGTTLGVIVAVVAFATRHPWYALLWIPLGYGFAWTGHFLLEKNTPATFGHPLWSFISDFRMLGLMMTGRLNARMNANSGPIELSLSQAKANLTSSENFSEVQSMAALSAGVLAPDFTLPTVQGGQVSLRQALAKGPVVLVFFKKSCPVCQYAAPFLERVFQANRAANVTVLGISQDKARDTKAFMREYGVTFSVALDDPAKYLVSNAYGLTNVPTIFYVAPSGEIEVCSVGWSKIEVEAVNQKLAAHREQPSAPLWRKGEDIQDFRAG